RTRPRRDRTPARRCAGAVRGRAMPGYWRPTDLREALAIRAGEDVTILAGGTDIYPARAARAAWGEFAHKPILDISAIGTLRGICETRDHWLIGPLPTWTELIRAPLPVLFDGLKRAAREVGGVQIQNRGTLAGNLCTASPAGDGAPNLIALDAEVVLASRDRQRVVAIEGFI